MKYYEQELDAIDLALLTAASPYPFLILGPDEKAEAAEDVAFRYSALL